MSALLCAVAGAAFPDVGHTVTDVDLTVAPGEVVMVTGPEGCGKSQVLRGVLGFAQPAHGSVSLFGVPLRGLHHDGLTALRQKVAFASEAAPLLANLTVRDNLAVPLLLRGVAPAEADRRVVRILGELGVSTWADARPHSVPALALRKALVARALVQPAHLLVLDEPSRGLGDDDKRRLAGLLLERTSEGIGVLLSIWDPARWSLPATRRVDLAPAPTT